MKRVSARYLTERDYASVKLLLDQNVSKTEIAERSGRSHATISLISRSNSFGEYQSARKEVGSMRK